jgi:hypothetical protein
LHDPQAGRNLIDFAEFQQQMMADCVCELARAARRASGGRKLVVFFYGYVFEFGAIRNGPATAGHYALRRLLDCPDIDVLCSPISYFDRGLGESGPAMTAAERHADPPGNRPRAGLGRRRLDDRRHEPLAAAEYGPMRRAELWHLVDGPGRDRLVRRPADVGGNGPLAGAGRTAA